MTRRISPSAYRNSTRVVAVRPPGLIAWSIYGFFYGIGFILSTLAAIAYGLWHGACWLYRWVKR